MAKITSSLSSRSLAVLEMIAAGNSYERILSTYPDLTYVDIFRAAKEALAFAVGSEPIPTYTLQEKQKRYPRAYESWTDEEEQTLVESVHSGMSVARIAGQFQRNRGAIRSRIIKLHLVNDLMPKERARLLRITKRQGIISSGTPAHWYWYRLNIHATLFL